MSNLYRTIIVGAGPAGSFCAYQLAKNGQQVALLEKEELPRYKPCGGAVTLRAQELIPFDISSVVERRVHEIIFTLNGERPLSADVEKPYGAMVMRDKFDYLLTKKAIEEGAQLFQNCKVSHVKQRDDRVLVKTHDGRTFEASFLVGADGVLSTVGRLIDLNRQQTKGFTITGEIKVSSSYLMEIQESVHIDPGIIAKGYGWIFPKGDHLSVGVGQFGGSTSKIREHFYDFLKKWDLLEGGTLESLRGSLIPLGGIIGNLVNHRTLLIGDAAGLVDPLSGEGIYYALKSAILAAEVILHQGEGTSLHQGEGTSLCQYQRLVRSELAAEFRSSLRLFDLFYHFTPFTYQVLERNPEILNHLLEMVSGKISHVVFYERMKGYLPIIKKLVMT